MAQSKREKRPKAGEVLEGEPTESEILAGASNAPSDIIVTFKDKKYALVELGFMDWRTYLACLLPAVEETIKSVLPVVATGARTWDLIKGSGRENLATIRNAALVGDEDALREALQFSGFANVSEAEISRLMENANDDKEFAVITTQLLVKPIMDVFSQVSLSDVVIKAMDRLPDMAYASLSASLNKVGERVIRAELMSEILEADGFDLFTVVMSQLVLYQERGKLRSFFEQMKSLIMSRMSKNQREVLGTPTK